MISFLCIWPCQNHVPSNVVRLLVDAWPEAVSVKDRNSTLLLHYALEKDSCGPEEPGLDGIKALVQASPDALEIPSPCGSLPLLHIANFNRISSTEVID